MEEAVKLIGSGPLVVLAAIGIVCVPFLYFDVRKRSRELVTKGEAHTVAVREMAEAHAKALKEAADEYAEALVRKESAYTEATARNSRTHDEAVERYNQRIDDLVREHKKELIGMVDRVSEAMKSRDGHQQMLIERTVALAESLERRAVPTRGRDRGG